MKKSTFFAGFTAIMATVVFTGIFFTAEALQGADPVRETSPGTTVTDYRPGKTNPVKNPGRLYLFRDDWLCTLFGNMGEHTLTKNWNTPTGTDLTNWENDTSAALMIPHYGNELNKNVISPTALAMGRIKSSAKDDVVGAFYYYSKDKNTVIPYVFFVDDPEVNTEVSGAFSSKSFYSPADADYYSINIAVGDLDRKLNDAGEYNDEIVVAFRQRGDDMLSNNYVNVVVLDKDMKLIAWNSSNFSLDYPTGSNYGTHPYFSVTMGDYDNDGKCEVAVGLRTADSNGEYQKYEISTYQMDSEGFPRYDHYVYDIDSGSSHYQFNAVDLTSGDFNGDGIDDIAVSISSFQPVIDSIYMDNLVPYLLIFTTDKELKLEKRGTWHPYDFPNERYGSVRGAGITSGLFKYNPTGGFSTARRQIAMASIIKESDIAYYYNVITFEIDDDFKPLVKDVFFDHRLESKISYDGDNTSIPKITAGNFKGIDDKTIGEQIAVSWAENKHPKFAVFDMDEELKLSLKYHGDFHPGQTGTSDQEFMSVPIVAADRDGKGYYLGAPIHLKVPKFIRANYVIQEPPKHLDYLPDDNDIWKVVRVSRNRNFYASFTDVEETTFKTTHEDKTNFDIGGSEKVSAKETVGDDVGIANADVTLKQSEQLAYDYDSVTKSLNGNYQKVIGSAQYNSDRDDYIQTQYKVMDIWRYPIYGLKTKDKKNGFYEVVMPGPTTELLDAWGFDLSDYYQPIHENGNILSYPQISDETFPSDLGNFKVDGKVQLNKKGKPLSLSKQTVETWGSGSGTRAIEWGEDSWSTSTKSHTHKLNFNADFQVGFHAEASEVAEKQKWYAFVDLSFHVGKSWSTTDFSENTMSSSKGITLVFPASGNSDQAYTFKPVVYSTKDGTLKLAHATEPLGSTQGIWWQRHYHGQPDLALNLPKKFHWVKSGTNTPYPGDWYVANDRQSRSRMRRLFLLHNEPKTKDTDKLFVATSPTAGDIVYVLTTVYNYSLDTPAGGFHVQFNYAEYNPDLKDGDPGFDADPSTNLIGDVWVDGLGALEHRDVYVKWDTKGLGGETPDTAKSYVIYLTVDPNNDVADEIHELLVDDQSPKPGPCPTQGGDSLKCGIFCGSNNQGYWPWDNSFMIFSPKQDDVPGQDDTVLDISIDPESLEVETTPESEGYGDYLFTHAPYRLKLKIVASEADKNYREVFFHDNDRIFSVKRSFGLNPGENDFYCEWTPEEPGEHTLKVVVFEDRDDSEKQDNIVTLDVNVLDSQRPASPVRTGPFGLLIVD